jgi:hypothetical protein
MRGGGGKTLKGGHCFSKRFRTLLDRNLKKKFSNDIFCKFCPTLQIRGFLREYVKEKSNFYCRTGFKIELLPKTQLGHFLQCTPELKIIN